MFTLPKFFYKNHLIIDGYVVQFVLLRHVLGAAGLLSVEPTGFCEDRSESRSLEPTSGHSAAEFPAELNCVTRHFEAAFRTDSRPQRKRLMQQGPREQDNCQDGRGSGHCPRHKTDVPTE